MIIVLMTLFLALSPVAANESLSYFQQGNAQFQDGQYNQAIQSYEAVLALNEESAAVYFNLGNAYFKTGKIGYAILNYERAKRLAPSDPDILYNLEIANLRVVDKIEMPPEFLLAKFWRSFKDLVSAEQSAQIFLVFYLIFMTLLVLKLLLKSVVIDRILGVGFFPLLILVLLSGSLFFLRARADWSLQEGVILVDKVDVKSSPAQDATDVFALHEGLKVHVTDFSGEFVRIELADGNVGWLPKEVIELIKV